MDRSEAVGMPPPAPRAAKSSRTSDEGLNKESPSGSVSCDTNGAKPKGSQKGRKARSRIFFFWTNEDVNKWLKKHHVQYYQLYGEVFKDHDITGRTLVRLTDCKLQTIGITDPEHREDLMRHILKLRLKVETQELKNFSHKGLSQDPSNK